jgi:phosphatidylserine/phosphatidylglycerophosphate/cardiolipin synthase-like enzyme
LPYPRGIELFCWPRPGGTDPDALRKLIKKGADVRFVDGLHMKLYWAEGRGAIVASANLSTNALGAGGLKEVGVRVDADAVDIERILAGLGSRTVTSKELRRLDRLHKRYMIKNLPTGRSGKSPSFAQWFESPSRPEWKITWIDSRARGPDAPAIKRILQEQYDERRPYWSVYDKRRDYKQGIGFSFFGRSPAPAMLQSGCRRI